MSGVATDVKVEMGDFVEKGAILALIRSSEVAGYVQQRISAEANMQIAKKNLEAAEDMHATGISSDKDLITAQRECAKAEAESKRIEEIFSIYNIGSGSEYIVKAPISGFVAERKINKGMQLRPDNSENHFTLSNMDEVWVVANIYETDISKVQTGFEAEVTTLANEGMVFKGKVDKLFNILDPETKAMKVRIRLANPGYLLKPEMFASVIIHYKESGSMAEIPAQSIIFDKSKNFVMIYRSKADIETREINIYKTVNDRSYINMGVKVGEKVISHFHLLVYDELNGG